MTAPGWMADSCIKWLTDITVRQDEAQGYYIQTAYRHSTRPVTPGEVIAASDLKPVEAMIVKSLIAQPLDGGSLRPGLVTIQGVAWTGKGKIVKVEVSIDEGQTWEPARLIGEDQLMPGASGSISGRQPDLVRGRFFAARPMTMVRRNRRRVHGIPAGFSGTDGIVSV